jgi:hypothetical protein
MEPRSEPTNPVWPFPFTSQDWEQTPLAVQAYLRTVRDELGQLHKRVEILEARLTQNAMTSSRPPSSDSPYATLIEDRAGLLVSEGYGVYQNWVEARQTCLAHLIR